MLVDNWPFVRCTLGLPGDSALSIFIDRVCGRDTFSRSETDYSSLCTDVQSVVCSLVCKVDDAQVPIALDSSAGT